MKISLNWLKEYIQLENLAGSEIATYLTMAGLEVEDIKDENEIYKDFIVGFVSEKKKHPNADKLSVCMVKTGKEELQIICGAPNVEEGQKVVFAPIGTLIPKGNFKISKAKIRGVESFGMICAEDELELSDDHSGIMILDNGQEIGTPITIALGLNDIIFEIGITPNRPDALSHIGVARDLAAIFKKELKIPEINIKQSVRKIEDEASIIIEDSINCPRYSGIVVKNIEVKESPEWLQNRLIKIGLRPINNIVDITNYVMYETGQPLHAFDLDMLSDHTIIVKSTNGTSSFTTLDSKQRELPAGTLMICDSKRPVAIAGVMGGENSEISSATKNILIESAYFNPSSIRKTSKHLNLTTDASYRFERGCNPDTTKYSAERAAQLIIDFSGGEILKGCLDIYPNEIKQKEVKLRYSRLTKVLGYSVEKNVVKDIIINLGYKILNENSDEILLKVPNYRPDVEREIDIIEEVARINGYDNIPTVEKLSISFGKRYDESEFNDNIKNTAAAFGLYEMINNPMQNEKTAQLTGSPIKILNPQSNDMAYLRTSLISGGLSIVQKNIYAGEKDLALFEIGNVFNKKTDEDIKSFDDYTEETHLLFILSGKEEEKEWNMGEKFYDFYSLKGLVEKFFASISLDNVLFEYYYDNNDRIYESYFIFKIDGKEAGRGGKVNKSTLNVFDILQDVYSFELNLNLLKVIKPAPKKFRSLLKYPKVYKDFAFLFDKSVSYNEVKKFIEQQSSGLLKNVKIFDIFESNSLGKKKSMAFSLEFYDSNRTLTDTEVDSEFQKLIKAVSEKFNAQLRGN